MPFVIDDILMGLGSLGSTLGSAASTAGSAIGGAASTAGGALAGAGTKIGSMISGALPAMGNWAKTTAMPAMKDWAKETGKGMLENMATQAVTNAVMPPQQQPYINNILSQPQYNGGARNGYIQNNFRRSNYLGR